MLLGGAGDLVTRHVAPALADLEQRGLLPHGPVVLVDRAGSTTADRRDALARSVRAQRPGLPEPVLATLLDRVEYVRLDLDVDDPAPALDGAGYVHLAVPPHAMPAAARALGAARPAPSVRVVVEKPYGASPTAAEELDSALLAVVPEQQLLRADHLLHHRAVRDLDVVRRWLAPRRHDLVSVRVTWDEPGTVDGRAASFDRSGALVDMLQSHLLQLVAAILAEPVDAHDEPAARADVLRSLRGEGARRARYAGYTVHDGVAQGSTTETWVRAALTWDDRVPVILETGKAVGRGRRDVVVRLGSGTLVADLRGRRLVVGGDAPGLPGASTAADDGLTASAAQFVAALSGDRTRFLGRDEVAQQWRVCAALAQAWPADAHDLETYEPGSDGPLSHEEQR